jgi:glycosyl transferase family 92
VKEHMEKQIAVRDMVDVQSLIFLAAYEHQHWAGEEPESVRVEREHFRLGEEGKPYLSICATYYNEAPYLQEWIEFHRLVGVERFFLYNNRSDDNHLEILGPYVEDGTVVIHDWPLRPGQIKAYDNCLNEHRDDSRWIAFLDVDEFLFSPSGTSLSDVLVDYEHYPGVGVNYVMFGTAGHRTTPPGLLLESHLLRDREPWSLIKNIVDPTRVVHCIQGHAFAYAFGTAVDENRVPIVMYTGRTQFTSVARLRINHYYLKSEAEGRAKLTTLFEGWDSRGLEFDELDQRLNAERDETIMQYVPALREALTRTASKAYP